LVTLSLWLVLELESVLQYYSSVGIAASNVSDLCCVKALGYKQEGHGFETRCGEILNLRNPSGRTRPWGLLSL
jgi:hypothetical protein